MQITTTGIVLREREHDDDRILTILTADRGVITAYARGAKKLRGRLLSGTELLCCSRFVLFQYRDRYQVDSAETEQNFFGLRSDVEKLSLAVYLAQLCAQVAPAEEEAGEFLRLILNSLYLLEKDKRPQRLVKAVFELRLLAMAGYMPDLVGCKVCGCYEAESMYFLPLTGDLMCGDCLGDAPPDEMVRLRLSPGVLAAMRHILYSEAGKVFNFTLSEEELRYLGDICELLRHRPAGYPAQLPGFLQIAPALIGRDFLRKGVFLCRYRANISLRWNWTRYWRSWRMRPPVKRHGCGHCV